MANPQMSARLQKVWDELTEHGDKGDLFEDSPDTSCTTGADNDGSSGWDIFENGFELAIKANGRPVFYVEDEDENFLFFIGTEDETEAKLRKLAAEG